MQSLLRFAPVLVMASMMLPGLARAADSFEVSGWVPYWRTEVGTQNLRPNLKLLTEVNPFIYTVQSDGTVASQSLLTDPVWTTLRAEARAASVRFIPTIMWSDPDAMDTVFKDAALRAAHVASIAREVYVHDLDGIDIDYEGKYAHTRPYFSEFLKDLHAAIGFNKWVMCTIEARTPLDARFPNPESIPPDIEYANDFKEINKYCDRVRIMTYDQGRFDLKLNAANPDPYVPIADAAWVEKVIKLATEEISPSKIVVGVPTYGYEYDMFEEQDGSGDIGYAKLWSFNPKYALDIAQSLGISPVRIAGEQTLSFPASRSPEPIKPLPDATRVLVWSDAEAIRQKAELAKRLGVRGIAMFKIDGGHDQAIWQMLDAYDEPDTAARAFIKKPDLNLAKDEIGGSGSVPTPAPAPAGTTTPAKPTGGVSVALPVTNLSPGMKGDAVRSLQQLLNKHGFTIAATGPGSPGSETTFFGNATYQALIRFQKANNIAPAIGHYGPLTRSVFQKKYVI